MSAGAATPATVVISGLTGNTKYYYRIQYSTDGGSTWTNRTEKSFWTARASGSTFTFDITSDSHVNILMGNAANWTQTLNDVASDGPDFLLDLGDTVAMRSVSAGDTAGAASAYRAQLPFFNIVSASSSIYLVPGNHEQKEGWHLQAPLGDSLPVIGTNAQKAYFPMPVPNTFYSGNSDTYASLAGDHLREDYYAWTWGDALFVVIDPFWFTLNKPYVTDPGGGETDATGTGDSWDWTLGQTQFNWLKTTLTNSTAKYKFVFTHQLLCDASLSGQEDYGHCGANDSDLVEWGGLNEDGATSGWSTERSGWGSNPIHQILVSTGVSAVFHGHDHQYAYEKRDGVVYQSAPVGGWDSGGTGFGMYTTGGGYTIQTEPNYGHLRVTVAPAQTTVEYIRGGATSSTYTYTIAPAAATYTLTTAVDPVGAGTTDPAVGTHSYTDGTVVNVTATHASGYVFDHWSGACTGSSTCSVTMNADKSVTAHFVPGTAYNLTTAVSPTGGGTTEPAVGVHSYPAGAVVSVTATPAAGYVFTGWGGACSGTGCCTVTMDADKTVTASFAAAVSHIAEIGSNTIKDSSNANLVVTTSTAVAAGDAIVIAYACDASQDINLTVTDSASNKYQQAGMAISQGNVRTYIFAAYNVTALPSGGTITINQAVYSSTAVAARAAVASAFRGLAPAGALEQTNNASGTSATPSSGAATTVQPVQLLVGAVGTEGPSGDTAGTWSNSFTDGQRAGTTGGTDATTNITVSLGWRIVTAAGDYTAAKSGITSRDWAALVATFKTTDAGLSYVDSIGSAQSKTAGTSLAITTNRAVAAGDDVLVAFATDPAGAVSSVTDSAGNTYSQVVDVTNTGNVRTMVYAAYNVTALPSGSTITINHASVTARSAAASAFRGLDSASVVDQTKTATGSSTSPSSGATATTAQADELLIGAIGLEGPHVDNPGVWSNSFTEGLRLGTSYGSSSGSDTDITVSMGWRIVGSTAAYTAAKSGLATSRDWAAAIATFKADYRLTVAVDPAGSATTSPAVGAHSYSKGSVVAVTPTAGAGYVFDHWSGACSGSGTCSVTMDADKTVTAHFTVNVNVAISKPSGYPQLTWPHQAAAVDHYAVYRSTTEPYFAAGPTYLLAGNVTPASPTTYPDSTAVLTVAGNKYFYLVGPVNPCGGACGSSNRTGAFVFGLVPGN